MVPTGKDSGKYLVCENWYWILTISRVSITYLTINTASPRKSASTCYWGIFTNSTAVPWITRAVIIAIALTMSRALVVNPIGANYMLELYLSTYNNEECHN